MIETPPPNELSGLESPSAPPQFLNEDKGVVRAAAVLAAGNVASRVLGLAREIVKANLFGASGLLDAFQVASYVPSSLFDLIIGGMVNSSLVPVFSEYAAKERRDELWGVLSTVLSVAVVVLLATVGLVELFTPQVAWLVGARNLEGEAAAATAVHLMRLATPAVLFLGLASILTGVLYALKRFTLPAFVGATFNGTMVLVALLRPDHIESLVWGLLLGALLQILLQLPALADARLRWQFEWRHPAIRRILRLYAPIVAGLFVNQLAVALSYNLATRTGEGSVSYMNFATTLYQFPLGLVVTALSIATLPTLAQQAPELTAFKRTMADGIRLVLVLILPAAAGLFALAVPIVALLFQHGEFTLANTQTTALVLRVYLFGLPFAAVDQMLVFASYARKDTWRPAVVGVVSIVVYLGVAVALLRPLGLLSLMVADGVKHMVHTTLMVWILQRQVGSLGEYHIQTAVAKSLFAALLTGLLAYGMAELLMTFLPLAGFVSKAINVVVSGGVGLVVYIGMVWLLDIQEAKSLRRLLRRQ